MLPEPFLDFIDHANARLKVHFQRWRTRVPTGQPQPSPVDLFEAVEDLTMRGGKRVRPALAYFAALCFDHGLEKDDLVDATLALELLQSALLIHDDIMDKDLVRRGGPTVHSRLSRLAHRAEIDDDAHVGASLGLLAGCYAFSQSLELLTRTDLPQERAVAAIGELARIQEEVFFGQHLDMVGGADPALVQDLKTASYTTRGPLRFGAILAGAPPEALIALERFGSPLGRAFQIRDDLLGTFGNSSMTGKAVGADLRCGKSTQLVEIGLARADEEGRTLLDSVLGCSDASDDEIAAACRVLEQTGARDDLEAQVDVLLEESLAALQGVEWHDRGLGILKRLAELIAHRQK